MHVRRRSATRRWAALAATGALVAASAVALTSTAASAAASTETWVPTLAVSEAQCATPGLADGAIKLTLTDTRASGETGVTYDISIATSTYIDEQTTSITLNGGQSRDVTLTGLYGGGQVIGVEYQVASGETWSSTDSTSVSACDVAISPAIDVIQKCTEDVTGVTASVLFVDAKPYNFGYQLYKGGRDNLDSTWHTVDGSRPVSGDTLTANAQGKASFALSQSVSEGARGPLTVGQEYTLVITLSSDGGSSTNVTGTKTFTVEDCDKTTPPVTDTQTVPTPVIHIGQVCLSDDGTSVKPYDLSFTWDGEKGKTFGVTYSFNKVNADGSLGKQVNGGFTDGQTNSLALWPNSEGIPAAAITRDLHSGKYAVSVYLTDFSTITSISSGGAGGYEGQVDGATATKQFEATTCAAAITTNVARVAPGAPVTISVSGAHPDEKLNFELHSTVVQLGTATADSNGRASLTATIPSSVPAGTHTVIVTGTSTHLELQLTVTSASTSNGSTDPATSTHKAPAVVQTDGDSSPMLWLTAAVLLMGLVVAGGAGLFWRRSRATD